MQARGKIFDDISQLMTNAMGVAQGAKDEAETAMKSLMDRWLADRDFVTREEFDAVGFYLSAHPLDAYERVLEKKRVRSSAEALAAAREGALRLAGTFISKKEMTSKTGKRFAFITFSDASGVFEATAFSEILAQHAELLVPGNSMIVDCALSMFGEQIRLTIQGLQSIDIAAKQAAASAKELRVYLDSADALAPLSDVLARGRNGGSGKSKVLITMRLRDCDEEVDIDLKENFALTHEMSLAVRSLPGVLDVREV